MRAAVLVESVFLGLMAIAVRAQSPAVTTSATGVRKTFEGASLRLGEAGMNAVHTRLACRGIDGELRPLVAGGDVPTPLGRCTGQNVPLMGFIALAYDTDVRYVSGLPNLPEQSAYTLEAKADNPATATKEDLRQMLQTMLIEKLKLQFHVETKEIDGFVVTVAKNGVKFRQTAGEEELIRVHLQDGPQGRLGYTVPKGNYSPRQLFDNVEIMLGVVPILDKTNLRGIFELSLTANVILPQAGGPRGGPGGGPAGGPAMEFDPPMPKALEDQLGLHMERAKVPVQYLVVDRFDKEPKN